MTQTNSFDITVTQAGDIYTVSGKDAAALYNKLQNLPPGAKNLAVGKLIDNSFTLRKYVVKKAQAMMKAAG